VTIERAAPINEKFEAALAAWNSQYESETYEGAYHSWTVPDSPVFNPAQAELIFGKLAKLFSETLQLIGRAIHTNLIYFILTNSKI
jgi:dienelactone hydrolase